MRLALVFGTACLLLAGCGGSSSGGVSSLAGSGAKTTAGTARFTLSVSGIVAGVAARVDENGTVSFAKSAAHIYRLVYGGGLPQEVVVDGPFTYTNGDVQAAMNDPSVKAWTKLDTRRLTAKQRRSQVDELAHVRAAAYLVYGLTRERRLGTDKTDHTTHFRGTVDPTRLAARLPVARRAPIVAAVHKDYADRPFQADFWIDGQGRVRRVHLAYRTSGGGHITVNAAYSNFGTYVDLAVPPASHVQDISP